MWFSAIAPATVMGPGDIGGASVATTVRHQEAKGVRETLQLALEVGGVREAAMSHYERGPGSAAGVGKADVGVLDRAVHWLDHLWPVVASEGSLSEMTA